MAALGVGLMRALEMLFYLGFGLVVGWLTWEAVELRWTLEHHGQVVEAEVVDLSARRGRTSTSWLPVVRFTTAEGRRVRAATEGAGNSDATAWARGSLIDVVYDPASPSRVMEVEELERVGWVLALLPGLGFVLLMLGLATARSLTMLRRARR